MYKQPIEAFSEILFGRPAILPNLPKYGYLNYLCSKLRTVRNLYKDCSTIRTPDMGHICKHDLKSDQLQDLTLWQVM